MGQVWSKADCDGIPATGYQGGRGSVLAVTAQNPGPDGIFRTNDDILAPLNAKPVSVTNDANPGPNCQDPMDRVRGFYSFHPGGAYFVFGDGSVRFVGETISTETYRALSTIADREPIPSDY